MRWRRKHRNGSTTDMSHPQPLRIVACMGLPTQFTTIATLSMSWVFLTTALERRTTRYRQLHKHSKGMLVSYAGWLEPSNKSIKRFSDTLLLPTMVLTSVG